MKTHIKKPAITLALGLSLSSLAFASEEHKQHQGMDHSKMNHAGHDMAGMDCNDPVHAAMDHCKGKAGTDHSKMDHSQHKGMDHSKMNHSQHKGMNHSKMDHSQHKGMDHSKMDHSQHKGMDHSKMDHSQHKSKIPVSDGSASEDIPMPFPGVMHMEDDPTLTKVMIDQLEVRQADEGENPIVLEAEAWVGKDLNKLWLKTDIEKVGSELEEAELQLLYSRAIAPYWDLQTGIRKDFKPYNQTWFTVGAKGLAPYFFETDAALFVGEDGRTAARVSAEYEMMLTQKTVLSPEVGFNVYGKDIPEAGVGSGLSDMSVGLRLRHEFKREFAPYIGVNWSKKFGKTADFARHDGESVEDTQLVAGVRVWF